LLLHEDVQDVAVVGIQDDVRSTEIPRAYVVLRKHCKNEHLTTKRRELLEYVQTRVADYKRLRGGVVFVDSIPRSPTGKILRRLLRHENEKKTEDGSKLQEPNGPTAERISNPSSYEHTSSQLDIPIAIIGIAAQLPSGTYSMNDLDYDTFWDFLVSRSSAYEKLEELSISPNP
jgi:hypothetical protein